MCYDIFVAGGEHMLSISVITCFFAGGEHITYFLQGEFFYAHKVSSSKKGRMLELDFDDTFVKLYHWSSILQAYIRVLHAQDFPRIMVMDVYCTVY